MVDGEGGGAEVGRRRLAVAGSDTRQPQRSIIRPSVGSEGEPSRHGGGAIEQKSASGRSLPEYRNPPINEAVLGVQTEPIQRPLTPHLGLFWREIRERYPKAEVQPALDPAVEFFGLPKPAPLVGFRVLDKPETPRCWFITQDDTELVQLQQDRLIHNWRKRRPEDKYPRFPRLRETFERELRAWESFVEREQLGRLVPNQCELTYINHLACSSIEDQGHMERFLRGWKAPEEHGFLPPAEDALLILRYQMKHGDGEPLGRLHVTAQPAILRIDNSPVVSLSLTARGRPEGDGVEGALRFLDRAHEWIVLAFDELTTPELHAKWGRV